MVQCFPQFDTIPEKQVSLWLTRQNINAMFTIHYVVKRVMLNAQERCLFGFPLFVKIYTT